MSLAVKSALACCTALLLAACNGGQDQSPLTPRFAAQSASSASLRQATDYYPLVQQLYVGYFGRPADAGGLAYFADMYLQAGAPTGIVELGMAYGSNTTVKALVDSFGTSQESSDLYPGDNTTFITAIYRNLFGRAPDAAGLAYWAGSIDSKDITRASGVLSIMSSAQGADITVIDNKRDVATAFTTALNSPARTSGYSGLAANVVVRAMLNNVSGTTSSAAFQATVDATVATLAASGPGALGAVTINSGAGFLIKTNGDLWAWGLGKLGDGTSNGSLLPKQIGTGFTKVVAGREHVLALRADGSLWAWGGNIGGQVGDGTTRTVLVQTQVGSGYSDIAAGQFHSLALKSDGSLWTWGYGAYGELGTGNIGATVSLPARIGVGFIKIAASQAGSHNAAIKSDGSLWTWGANWFGQLGDGTTADSLVPKQIGTGYTAVSAGEYFTVALKTDGSLWAWGKNEQGQLGDGTVARSLKPKQIGSGFSKISAGYLNGAGVKADGTLWIWGNNEAGQLADGTTDNGNSVPRQIGTGFSSVAAGHLNMAALKADGSEYTWGYNANGALGDGTQRNSLVPKLVALPNSIYLAPPTRTADSSIIVSSVLPQTAYWDKATVYTVTGKNLSSAMTLTVGSCTGAEAAGGSATERSYSCKVTPQPTQMAGGQTAPASYARALLSARLSDKDGNLLSDFTVSLSTDPAAGTGGSTGGSGGTGSGYLCPTTKTPFDPEWIQSHGSYWAAASAHDSGLFDVEKQYCSVAQALCLVVASAAHCPG